MTNSVRLSWPATPCRLLTSLDSRRTDEHTDPHRPIPDDPRLQHHPGGVVTESSISWHAGACIMRSLASFLFHLIVGLVIVTPMLAMIVWDGIRYLCGNKDALRCR